MDRAVKESNMANKKKKKKSKKRLPPRRKDGRFKKSK
jgi:hypothetical protein